MNWGHLGSAVKCSHSSLTVRTVFAIVFVGILRSVKCWAGVRRKTPGSFLRAAADAQSLASSSRAYRSNTQAQDCQNPSCQGEKSTLSGCDSFLVKKKDQK